MADVSTSDSTEFGNYSDADTLMVISPTRRYMLHASILRRHSTLFKTLLEADGPKLSKKAENKGISLRYRLVLVDHGAEYRFHRIELDSEGRAADGSTFNMGSDAGKIPAPEFKHYHTLLRAFYQYDLKLDESSIANILREAIGVLGVAEYIGAVPTVTKIFEGPLLARGQSLQQAIAMGPHAWIDLGYRLSSRAIFKESLIHLVGRYNEYMQTTSAGIIGPVAIKNLIGPVRQIVEEKVKELKDACVTLDRKIASYYPKNLHRFSTTGRADADKIGKADYAQDIMSWIAVALVKHWFCQTLTQDMTHHAKDFGFNTYKKITTGTYLTREQVIDFHDLFPMSSRGQAVVEKHLHEIKEGIKTFAHPLLINRSDLDPEGFRVEWLTCTEVKNKDYPWERELRAKKRALAEAADDDEDEEMMEDEERHVARPAAEKTEGAGK